MDTQVAELIAWLAAQPPLLLFAALAGAAFAENIVPPLPADTAIAIGAFVAARGDTGPVAVWSAVMLGNVGGALLMYALGRRLGTAWVAPRIARFGGPEAWDRVSRQYAVHGAWALALSRFLPGVRAVVPPLAGALRVGWGAAVAAMSIASAVWYGLVTWLAFTLGSNAESLLSAIGTGQRRLAVGAGVVLAIAAVVLWRRSRRG